MICSYFCIYLSPTDKYFAIFRVEEGVSINDDSEINPDGQA